MKSQLSEDLQFILRASFGYTENMFKHDGRFKSLIFEESGLTKLGNSLGIISGMYLAGDVKRAEVLASEFIKTLRYLGDQNNTEIEGVCGHKFNGPATLIKLVDDGTAFGFAVRWYKYINKETFESLGDDWKNKCMDHGHGLHKCKYIFFMNGGFIFHGWSFTRTGLRDSLKDCFGVHT